MPDIPSSLTDSNQLVAHLFRHEAGRIASVLTCMLGFDRLDLAEDIVQDTMVKALQSWRFQGIPDNPSAWLYRVAKNNALDVVRRETRLRQISPEVEYLHQQEATEIMGNVYFFDDEITDSQLRMLFAICHPAIGIESQMAMCLKILCGLSVREIAGAFLTTDETIAKRIYRAKEKIRQEEIRLEVPMGQQLAPRLDSILKSIYLLFNEGYNSSHPDQLIRQDMCQEAMRLGLLLTQTPQTQQPAVDALLALMCFQSARFNARTDDAGGIILLADQDRSRWNQDLIRRGHLYLNRSAEGPAPGEYHLEAGIAMQHCIASSYETTDWPTILLYYDMLMMRKPSPVVALHRAVGVANVKGPVMAIDEVVTLSGLDSMHHYHAILGDLYEQNGQPEPARTHYQRAIQLTTSIAEKALIERKLSRLQAD
ncbi:sigma-70 family RNA polymerase sigma factor [Spirosoma sp. KCTC 42546]|uniref:RNA polymerase sigma factor n=1 Tax=Spirosoma sp. KCTC 42546 TaxID=2520506 RepID=UPI00115B6E59|nr:sigma-70 family RNA polymerase sigma factor [Spirosoma sp. KCTC 42546]QDK79262.1 sigma-70 family RNA polymerase sigma factor [Spirosoma sp. KCTC 42546]